MATERSHEFRRKLIDFAIKTIHLTKKLPKSPETAVIIFQIIKSSTSMGSNYTESMFALTKADFIHCLNICKKETAETLHWLEVLLILNPKLSPDIESLKLEADGYLKIFISSIKTAQGNKK